MSKDLYNKLAKIIEREGGSFVRMGKGSHRIWERNGKKSSIPKPCKRPDTANAALKNLGLKKQF